MKKAAHYGIWLIPFLTFLLFRIGLGFNGLYGQDSHEYLRYCRELLGYFQGAPIEGNFFWPVGYPMFGALLAFPLRSPELALMLVSVLSLSGCGWLTYLMLERLYPEKKYPKALFVLLFLTLSPFMLKGGLVVMSDMLATYFLLGAFVAFLNLTETLSLSMFLLFVVCAAFAVLTRYPVAFLLVFPSIWILLQCLKEKKAAWIFSGAFLALVCLLPQFWLKEGGEWMPQKPEYLELGWSVKNYFLSVFHTPEGSYNYRLPNLIYAFSNFYHPGYIFTGLLLVPFVKLKNLNNTFAKITLLGLAIYFAFLAGMPFQNQRFFIISFPLVLLILYPSFSVLWEDHCPKWMKNLVWIPIVMVQIAFFAYGFKPILKRNLFERKMVDIVQKYHPEVLYTFDVDIALESYRVPCEVKNLWKEQYETFENGASVLFNLPAFSQQWKGRNPMLNWETLNANYELKLTEEFDHGWALYEIGENRVK